MQFTPHPASASLYSRMVDTVSDYAIYALGVDGTVRTWNCGAERIKGYSAAEIIGQSFELFYPKEAIENRFPQYALEVAARDGRIEDEGWRVRKDGTRFWARVVITALRDDSGELIGFAKVTRDSTERKEIEDALRASEERFRLLVENVKDYSFLMLDPNGIVVSWNEGAQRLKGYSADEIVGSSFEAFYPPEAVAAGFPRHELEVARREGRFEDEGWRMRKDGSRFWANVAITALRNGEGRLVGFGKVTRDLTARREAEEHKRALAAEQAAHAAEMRRGEELRLLNQALERAVADATAARDAARKALAEAEEAYRELDQFAYVASHDLKAPLRGIASLAQWIEEDTGDRLAGDSVNHMRLLQARVNRMQALIDGILVYSRAGRVLTHSEDVDTGKLVQEVIDLLAAEGVRFDVDPQMPRLETERTPLQQVFMNLIGNAVKHGCCNETETATVAIGWRDLGTEFEFSVSDSGPGIAPEYHERIWGLFQTLAARDKVEGTGIGLAVVKKMVERRGGHVTVESEPGRGATFRFTWPKPQTPESL